jgi:hypothetical protein
VEGVVKQHSGFEDLVDATDHLGRGRRAYAERAWRDAYEALSLADGEGGLRAEDLEHLATSATCSDGRTSGCAVSSEPVHDRGVVEAAPGLYFVGRPFLYGFTSSLIGGVGRDAEHIVKHIASAGSNGRRGAEPEV